MEKNAGAQVRGTDSSVRPVRCFGWRRAVLSDRIVLSDRWLTEVLSAETRMRACA